MAESINDIQAQIIAAKEADPVIGTAGTAPLNNPSDTAEWRLWSYNTAVAMQTQQELFDDHKVEVESILASQMPHTEQWYATKAKAFQYGDSLPADSDVYAVIDPTVQVVSFAAAKDNYPFLRIKVAKNTGGVLGPLSGAEFTAFQAYMNAIKDAGIPIEFTNNNADSLRLSFNIFYDPQILDNTGARLDGSAATPVQDAINAFIDNLPFNVVFIPNDLVTALKAVEGVTIAELTYVAAKYGLLPYTAIGGFYVPDAGYMDLDSVYFTDNTIYTAY